jgi:serine/threonine-protein kinase
MRCLLGYGGDTQPMERPGQALFQTCADESKELTDLTWTAFSPDEVHGTGTYSYQLCEPNCAAGHRLFFLAVVHVDGPLPQMQARNARPARCLVPSW